MIPVVSEGSAFRFFPAHVVSGRRLSPSMVRVTFGGEGLAGFEGGGRDQSLSLFLPHPGQDRPVLPSDAGDDWYAAWRAMDPQVRAVMRAYTVREQRRDPVEVDIDFALHGDGGPASRWAACAGPGDRVVLLGPAQADNRTVCFQPPPGADRILLFADLTALPAVEASLAWLPPGAAASVWIEVPHAEDVRDLATAADAEVTWLVGRSAFEAVRAAELPSSRSYAWIAGEAGTVKALRRHLVGERGFDKTAVTFTGYWKRGSSQDEARA
jgi:NADPH-dependent ferric siderophore reductase